MRVSIATPGVQAVFVMKRIGLETTVKSANHAETIGTSIAL